MIACGLDIGSTNVKAVLCGDDGRTLWEKSVPTPRREDGLGIATDAVALVALLEDLVIEGWGAAGGGRPLAAIAAAGVGEDGVCADEALRPMGLAIPWFDKRAIFEVVQFRNAFSLTRVDFHTTAAKWMWLRTHRASEINPARHWIALTDYASSLWCGRPFMSETLAARTGCYDVFTRRWNEAALAHAGAPPLPRVLKAGEVAGTAGTGRLKQSGAVSGATLIVAGGHDHLIASSAIQRLNAEARIDSLGTANAIYGETRHPSPQIDGSLLEASVPARGGGGLSLLGVVEFAALLRAQFSEETVRRVLALPRLPGSPGGGTDEDATIRRTLEELALKARGFFAALDRAGVPRGQIFGTGGWSRSTALMELRASMFREPVTVVDEPELVGQGAALFALEAAAGKPCPFSPAHGLRTIDPIGRWAEAYAAL